MALRKSSAKKGFSSGYRIIVFLVFITAAAAGLGYRLFDLTFVRHEFFLKSAKGQQVIPSAMLAGRGNIYFSDAKANHDKLAVTNKESYYIFTNPHAINDVQYVSEKLGVLINRSPEDIGTLIAKGESSYLVLARGLSKHDADAVKKQNISGISVAKEISRYYVKDNLAAHALGFVGYEGNQRVGQYGVEAYYDQGLSGHSVGGRLTDNKTYAGILSIFSSRAEANTEEAAEYMQGEDVVLTIDFNVQQYAETRIAEAVRKWSASGGSVIVQEAGTGKILAMASSPSYDPNEYSKYDYTHYLNPTIQDIFEPGSSFKSITMAAALDAGAVTAATKYKNTGSYEIAGLVIKNATDQYLGAQTMNDVMAYSLNTGSIFAQEEMGNDPFIKYVVSFGFGQKTGIDLGGELAGNINNLYSGRKINFATASFGQGVAVTPIQLVNAYSAIANGGRLMKPRVVEYIKRLDGTKSFTEAEFLDVPISEKTSREMTRMLTYAVEKGIKTAKVDGYSVAAKTGTAQIPDAKGGYRNADDVIHNIVGFVPATAPRFTILIKLDQPKGARFSSETLAPEFANVARFLLQYYNVPPSK